MWSWASRRRDAAAIAALAVGAIGCLGGLVLFATQLPAIQRPVFSTFVTQLDASMAERHWNRLEPDALVFDPLVYRAPTLLGRPTHSSLSWYTRSDAWEQLRNNASPAALRKAGFTHMYVDRAFWDGLDTDQQRGLGDACVRTIDRMDGIRSETDYTKDFRLLLDIRGCG